MHRYIGIMSGTSLDGLDLCLVEIDQDIKLVDSLFLAFPSALHAELLALCAPTTNELERLSIAEQAWATLAAQGVHCLLQRNALQASDVTAIGSHGQTIRHHPQLGFSVQIGSPALLVELTQISVISQFRQRDIAAGGQGAPLVPAFHAWLFAHKQSAAAIVNIGGFSNISFLHTDLPVQGFDCGPGNVLMDAWIQQHQQHSYDAQGDWARTGQCQKPLLDHLLNTPYFQQTGPKSTGRELFNLVWLQQQLDSFPALKPADVQATLTELTCIGIARAIKAHAQPVRHAWICGGGAHNKFLLERLNAHLAPISVGMTDELGVPADWMEAMAFAWLAHCCLEGIPANRPEVTGARGLRVLGAIYPA